MNKEKFSFSKYECFIFDFDGVILDSNLLKEAAIEKASKIYKDDPCYQDFLNYFKKNNGITREKKIYKFFSKPNSKEILKNYSLLLKDSLFQAKLIDGIESFLKKVNKLTENINILSGGDQNEILKIIERKNLGSYFCNILGGPNEKAKNLKKIKIETKTVYFGDSYLDYELAMKNNFDFVFVSEKTRLKNWRNALDFSKDNCMSIKNFVELNNV
tara:strand:+ start:2085 stop:2729 length:645 start_codon:yes stop_codon:yes gene_type:complete